eukprot:1154778-Pelagomonas_calceolata.AAC.1
MIAKCRGSQKAAHLDNEQHRGSQKAAHLNNEPHISALAAHQPVPWKDHIVWVCRVAHSSNGCTSAKYMGNDHIVGLHCWGSQGSRLQHWVKWHSIAGC